MDGGPQLNAFVLHPDVSFEVLVDRAFVRSLFGNILPYLESDYLAIPSTFTIPNEIKIQVTIQMQSKTQNPRQSVYI